MARTINVRPSFDFGAKKKDLKKKLEAEVKKRDDVKRFEMYAEQSPEFAALLAEFKEL